MKPPLFRHFLLRLVILTLMIMVVAYFLFRQPLSHFPVTGYPFVLIYFFLITLLFHLYILKSYREAPGKFTTRYLGANGIKMLVYMISAGVYLLLNRKEVVQFLVYFFSLYLFFTIFEIREILTYLKKNHISS
jgi:hypothetical protein